MNLTYPAIITHEDDLFYIGFPDIEENIEDCFYVTYGDRIFNLKTWRLWK